MCYNSYMTKTNELKFFDIDDTLLHTTALIGVVKNKKLVKRLTNAEFNTYKLNEDESFDFSEFRCSRKFAEESKQITRVINIFKRDLNSGADVRLLTAREDFDCKTTFLNGLRKFGIDTTRIHVHRSGNLMIKATTAEKKAVWVRRYLDNKNNNYNSVTLYDDSLENLRVFKLLEREYPEVKFNAFFVTDRKIIKI